MSPRAFLGFALGAAIGASGAVLWTGLPRGRAATEGSGARAVSRPAPEITLYDLPPADAPRAPEALAEARLPTPPAPARPSGWPRFKKAVAGLLNDLYSGDPEWRPLDAAGEEAFESRLEEIAQRLERFRAKRARAAVNALRSMNTRSLARLMAELPASWDCERTIWLLEELGPARAGELIESLAVRDPRRAAEVLECWERTEGGPGKKNRAGKEGDESKPRAK